MSIITLTDQNLTKLTENNLTTLCELNNFKPNKLKELYLNINKLTNLNFITENTPFINLKHLDLGLNKLKKLNIKYLIQLNYLDISFNKNLKEINEIQYLTELNYLNLDNLNIIDLKPINNLIKINTLSINNLNLDNEYETVEILKTMKKLNILYCSKTFKNYTKEQLKKQLFKIKNIMY